MAEFLGTSLVTWLGIALVGGFTGLVLGVTAQPQWSALPRWLPKLAAKLAPEPRHFAYGALLALLGVVVVYVAGQLVQPLGAVLAWLAAVLAASVARAEPFERKRIFVAHAKVIGGAVALSIAAYVFAETFVLR